MGTGLSEIAGITRGVTAVIGSGGKTTMLRTLCEELKCMGTVILTTSTHIFPFPEYPVVTGGREAVVRCLEKNRALCIGTPADQGKLTAPGLSFEMLAELADYVLVEADGSKGLPLKAHASYEPVIPECAGRTVVVAGADGIGGRVIDVCHRAEIWAGLAGCHTEDTVTAENAARVIRREGMGDFLFINKAEEEHTLCAAREMAAFSGLPSAYGSLLRRDYNCVF